MKKAFSTLVLISALLSLKAGDFNGNLNIFLQKHVKNGLVNYSKISQQESELESLMKLMAEKNLSDLSKMEKKTFFINSYNLCVINQVISNWPVENPLHIDGFFKTTKFNIAGTLMTLDHLENEILRKQFPDARLHFVLVCGAKGCPPIANYAFKASSLNAQMNERTTFAMNKADFIRVDEEKQIVKISEIFYWFEGDFTRKYKSFLEFINQYRTEKIPVFYKVEKYLYDWSINKQ